jgi:hypothetical protein
VRKEKRKPSASEQAIVDEAEAMREEIIQVDSFEKLGRELTQSGYVRPALLSPYATPKVAAAAGA